MRSTHTYATMELSRAAYSEIRRKLKRAGYEHAFHDDGLIALQGIAVTPGPKKRKPLRFKVVVTKGTATPLLVAPASTKDQQLVMFDPKKERIVIAEEVVR